MDTYLLLEAIRARVAVSDEAFDQYLSMMVRRTFEKGEHILRAGDIPRFSVFILKGCMRTYYIGADGNERTTYFAEESYWIGDLEAMRSGKPTEQNLQALEYCEALTLDREKWELAYKSFDWLVTLHGIAQQRRAAKLTQHIGHILTDTAETNYLRLLQERPKLVQRVPQYYIASYLGITPETLSRIRKKISCPDLLI